MSGRRISYIGRDENDKAIWVETGGPEHQAYLAGATNDKATFIPDEGTFVSPIDGKTYSGKAGMREHNARHNVINNRDLAGLPTGVNTGPPPPRTEREREKLRRHIGEIAYAKGYLNGQ